MNPIRLLYHIVRILGINYFAAFIALFFCANLGYLSSQEWLDRILAIAAYVATVIVTGAQWINETRELRLDLETKLANQVYPGVMMFFAFFACGFYDFGIFLEASNIILSDDQVKYYFFAYTTFFGGFTAYLIPELFKTIKDYTIRED